MASELGQPGQIIDGKYRIVRLLGTGGMGAVFEGENLRIRRRVAIKMLHSSVSSQPEVVRRFEREAQAAALVGSEHICEVLDLGTLPDDTRYMVMEYLEGDTLSGFIEKSGRLPPQQSIPILNQILEALGAAHAAGIIHRDLKPDNVFIIPQKSGMTNFVKILDFGVSKFSQMGGETMNATRAGAVVGTPYYMSPEQARGSSAIDQRTDIYAIGVLLYQATTGQVPYQAETFNELLFKIVLEVAPPPQTYVPDIDPEFAAIIMRAMARDPAHRYQTCQQFREALVQYQVTRLGAPPGYAPQGLYNGGTSSGGRDPVPQRTEVMDLSRIPSVEGTMPMQPGLSLGNSQSNAAPMQSGENWAQRSNPGGVPVGPQGPIALTANSWGNASSPANTARSRNGLIVGVIAAVALTAVGGAVAAFVIMGKPASTKAAAPPPPASVVATAAPPTTAPTAVAPPPTEVAAASASAVVVVTPSASASTGAPPAESAKPPEPGSKPAGKGVPVARPANPHGGFHPAEPRPTSRPPAPRPANNGDLGY